MMDGVTPLSKKPFVFHPPSQKGFLDPKQTVQTFGIQNGEHVADFGCGSGYLTIPIAKLVGANGVVYAVDILEGPLEHVQSRASLEDLRNIQVIRANLETLGSTNIPESSVDTILMSNILFQSAKPEDILKEAFRVLKPEGRIIIVEWYPDKAPIQLGKNVKTKEELQKLIEQNRFQLQKEFVPGPTHYGLIFQKATEEIVSG